MVFKKEHIPWNKNKKMIIASPLKGKTYEEIYGKERSIEQRNKLSESHKGKTWEEMYGDKLAEEMRDIKRKQMKENNPMYDLTTVEKIRVVNTGKCVTKETRKKQSEAHAGLKPHLGCHHSEETKKLLSLQRKGKTYEEIMGDTKAKEMKMKLARYVRPVKDTSIEIKIQNFLKKLNIEFITHKYMHIEHFYPCDIFVPLLNLVIECDGNYWHNYPDGLKNDNIRTKELQDAGFNVLRLWESEIRRMNIEDFNEKLEELYESICSVME